MCAHWHGCRKLRLALPVSVCAEVVKKKRAMSGRERGGHVEAEANTKPVNKWVKMCGKLLKKSQKKRECGSEPGRGGQKRQRLTWRERMGGGQADLHLPESGSDCNEGPFAR